MNTPEFERVLRGESLSANSTSLADRRAEARHVSPAKAESLHQDVNVLSRGPSFEPAINSDYTEATESDAGQQEVVGAQSRYSRTDVVDEFSFNWQVSETANAGRTALECTLLPGVTIAKTDVDSEIAKRRISEKVHADPTRLNDGAINLPSSFATSSEVLTESAVADVSLAPRLEQKQTSLNQAVAESAAELSTAEPSCELNAYGYVYPPVLTEPKELDRFSYPLSDSSAPATAEFSESDSFGTSADSHAPIVTPRVDYHTVVGVIPSEHSFSRKAGASLVYEGASEKPVRINQRIRASLANSLGLDAQYPEHVVAAITLACHPWPDCEISQNDIDCIAGELCPGFNINHPSMLEIAVDRLLRFEEALQFNGATGLSASYATAALALESYNVGNAGDRKDDSLNSCNLALIASPIGLGTSSSNSASAMVNSPIENGDEVWHTTIISLLGSAVFRGSRDTGIALGSEETGVSVSRLAEHLGVELPEKLFDEYLDKLDDRVLDILRSRTYKLGLSDTLVDIAERWNITRERVRQIETKASERLRDRFSEVFKRLGKQSIAPLSSYVFGIDVLYTIATRIAGYSRHREILSGFLADIFGPWQKAGHWIYHSSLQDRVGKLRDLLAGQGDAYGIVARESIEIGCDGLFLTEAERDQFLKEELGFGNYFGIWTNKNTMRCQVAAALRKIGRPATKEELAELLEYPTQNVSSVLGNIEGVVRADRYRWGFDEWIDDAYDGIYGEIEQRINEYNGSVPIHILMSEIPAQFDVAENSVKAYLASSAFVVENGMVRMASNEEYVPRSPSRCADAIRIGDRWGYRSLIYERHFNGYSLGVNFDVAFANGLRPGDDLIVPVEGCDEEVSLIWRSHNLNRLVDVGRVTNYLLTRSYNPGETLILIPSREKIEIIHERDLHVRFPELTLQRQFNASVEGPHSHDAGTNGEVCDPLLDLLGGDE